MKKQRTPAKPPRNPKPIDTAGRNRQLAAQRRKVLGAHYAAKYRVGKK